MYILIILVVVDLELEEPSDHNEDLETAKEEHQPESE
jgi:hypothetical protein